MNSLDAAGRCIIDLTFDVTNLDSSINQTSMKKHKPNK